MSEHPSEFPIWDTMKEKIHYLFDSRHEHDWDLVDVWHPTGQPIHPRDRVSMPFTIVLIICRQCHYPQTMELDGVWTIEQLRSTTGKD